MTIEIPEPRWAIVEIMGHRTRAGAISDATIGGATFLMIEHPSAVDHTGEEPLTEYYAPSAIFAIRPCSHEQAIEAAKYWRPIQSGPPALGPGLDELVDIEIVDDFDDEEYYDGDIEAPRSCRICGCTDDDACAEGCIWVPDPQNLGNLCSACLPAAEHARTLETAS